MNGFFRRLPLPVKLMLIGLVPFLFLVYLAITIYNERSYTIRVLSDFTTKINESNLLSQLIESLQKERRLTFLHVITATPSNELSAQRRQTDSILNSISQIETDHLHQFEKYTFLNELPQNRRLFDSLSPSLVDAVTSYYTEAIFRVNSLNIFPADAGRHLQHLREDLEAQQTLSQMITYFGIIRANIYNLLHSRGDTVKVLYGTRGIYRIYKSYESEFMIKAPSETIDSFQQRLHAPQVKPAVDYVDRTFMNFKLDNTFTSETWWTASGAWVDELYKMLNLHRQKVDHALSFAARKENQRQNNTFFFLLISLGLIIFIVFLTIRSVTRVLNELKFTAKRIAKGAPINSLPITSNDVIGDLALSISEIDENNRLLARSAEAIGHGDFSVPVKARSEQDMLGHSLIRMKKDLENYTTAIEKSKEESQRLALKYQTIFYRSPLPKIIYDEHSMKILEVNDTAVRHYGYSQKEFQQLTMLQLESESATEELGQEVDVNGHTVVRHKRKSGEDIIVELTSHPIEFNEQQARLAVLNDITLRRKTEEAMRTSEQIRGLVMNAALDAIICVDVNGKIIVWNPQAEKIFGWKENEAIGRSLADTIIPEQHKDAHAKGMGRYLQTGEHHVLNRIIEITALNRSGKEFPVELSITHINKGGFNFFCAFIRDITLRKKAEESIKALAVRNEQILLTMQDGFVLMDTQRNIVDVNPSYCSMLGYSRDELLKMKIDEIEVKLSMDLLDKRLEDVKRTGSVKFEGQNKRKDGTVIDVEISTSVMETDGQMLVAAFIREITERKRAEEQLSGERNLLRSLIDNLPDYIYVKDRQSRYIISNKAFVDLVGAVGEGDTVGKKVTDLFNREIWAINESEDKRVLDRGDQVIDRDEPIVTRSGENLWLLTTKIPLKDKEGRVIGILGISKDITERKRAEKALQKSYEDIRELASHLENIREEERISIAREIHDELGQQLTVLKMDISWLNKKLIDADENVRTKITDLLQLLETTVKTVRKISSELRPSMLDDLGLVAALEWQSQEFEKRSGVKSNFLAIVPEMEIDKKVSTQIFRIYQESLTNVARHSQATEVMATLKFEKGNLILTIIDNGQGFVITGIENKKTLGILGMKERAAMMGGEYNIESTPGRGTTIIVQVPVS